MTYGAVKLLVAHIRGEQVLSHGVTKRALIEFPSA